MQFPFLRANGLRVAPAREQFRVDGSRGGLAHRQQILPSQSAVQSSQPQHRVRQVDQTHRIGATHTARVLRNVRDQRHMGKLIVERLPMTDLSVFQKLIAVVSRYEDRRILAQTQLREHRQDDLEFSVDAPDRAVVHLDHLLKMFVRQVGLPMGDRAAKPAVVTSAEILKVIRITIPAEQGDMSAPGLVGPMRLKKMKVGECRSLQVRLQPFEKDSDQSVGLSRRGDI